MKYFKSNGGFDLSLIDLRNFMQNMLEFGYISPIMLTRQIELVREFQAVFPLFLAMVENHRNDNSQ